MLPAFPLLGWTAPQAPPLRPALPALLSPYQPKAGIKGVLEIPGTDSLAQVGHAWNRAFQRIHPAARLVYLPQLSREALGTFIEGSTVLAFSAREMRAEERERFRVRFGYLPMRIPVCLDANLVFVHPQNPLARISMEQLEGIFGAGSGAPRTWADLGVTGPLAGRPIVAYAREEDSAVRGALASSFRSGGIGNQVRARGDSVSLAESIQADPGGIAVGPMAARDPGMKVLPVIPFEGSEARLPTQETVAASRYSMPMLYYAYVNRAPGQALPPMVDAFLHFLLSRDGQATVAEGGLYPGPVEFLVIALKRLDR